MRLSPGQKDSALVCVSRPCIFPGLIQEMERSDNGGYKREHWRGGTVWFRRKKSRCTIEKIDILPTTYALKCLKGGSLLPGPLINEKKTTWFLRLVQTRKNQVLNYWLVMKKQGYSTKTLSQAINKGSNPWENQGLGFFG